MGRIKKYQTPEEKQESRKKASHKYYWKHKEECDAKQRERDKLKREKGLL